MEAVEKYGDKYDLTQTYANIINAYYSLLDKEIQFYQEILDGLNNSKGTISSLQKVSNSTSNKTLRKVVDSLINSLNELTEYLKVRLELVKKIQKKCQPSDYDEFQKLIKQNSDLDYQSMSYYSALLKQKETLSPDMKKSIDSLMKNVLPNKNPLTASLLLAITMLANACGGLQETVSKPSTQPAAQTVEEKEEKAAKKSEKNKESILESADEVLESMREINREYESNENGELRRDYQSTYALLEKCMEISKKEKLTASELYSVLQMFTSATHVAKGIPESVSLRITINNKTFEYRYGDLQNKIMSAYKAIINAGFNRALLLYDLANHDKDPAKYDEALKTANSVSELIKFGKKEGLPDDAAISKLDKQLLKLQVRITFEKD